jgi:hypothetical protein
MTTVTQRARISGAERQPRSTTLPRATTKMVTEGNITTKWLRNPPR